MIKKKKRITWGVEKRLAFSVIFSPWLYMASNIKFHFPPEHIPDVKLSSEFHRSNGGSFSTQFKWQTKNSRDGSLGVQKHHTLAEGLLATLCHQEQEIDDVHLVDLIV